jgi:hypothetical protein
MLHFCMYIVNSARFSGSYMINHVEAATACEQFLILQKRYLTNNTMACNLKLRLSHACRRTADGNAYPVDIPWGQNGAGMQAVCAASIYAKLAVDGYDNVEARRARCLVQRQLGFLLNHKCTTTGSKCVTSSTEGWSYMVGCGPLTFNFNSHVHCRVQRTAQSDGMSSTT